jgi:hypothetical protein
MTCRACGRFMWCFHLRDMRPIIRGQ